MKEIGLDYEVVATNDGFQVWTPDIAGAVLGSGITYREAIENALANMKSLCDKLEDEVA